MARSLTQAVVTVHAIILRMLSAGPRTGSLLVRWIKQTKTFESAAHFTTHNALTKLQVAGLIQSSPSKQSGTMKVFFLTQAGEKVAKEHGKNLAEIARQFHGIVTPPDLGNQFLVDRSKKVGKKVIKKVVKQKTERVRAMLTPAQREAKNAKDRARRAAKASS